MTGMVTSKASWQGFVSNEGIFSLTEREEGGGVWTHELAESKGSFKPEQVDIMVTLKTKTNI